MKRSLILYFALMTFLCTPLAVAGQAQRSAAVPPPDIASYTIAVRYDPETHKLTGEETAVYHNRTEAPIPDLVFHLYLNAFRSENTVWMQEAGVEHRGFNYDSAHPGWIKIDQLATTDGMQLSVEAVDPDETLVRAALPRPVSPGETVTVALSFTAQLPKVFARTGWGAEGDFLMAGQWFPKFGVWESAAAGEEGTGGAWNAYPFHANSEFYADFGAYDVRMTLPESWIVGATGSRVGEAVANDDGTATHHFHAEHVIDFAWAASPLFLEQTREVDGITVRLLYTSDSGRRNAKRAMDATEEGLRLYAEWYGPYGKGLYDALSVVMTPADARGAGGMEYPQLFTVGALGSDAPPCIRMLEVETLHELGHQWFQSVVATNEAEEPWLDEGFTDYSTVRAMNALYDGALSDCGGWTFSYLAMHRLNYLTSPEVSMYGKAWDFDIMDYAVATYSKPVVAFSTLERLVGDAAMRRFLHTYFDRFAFTHPSTHDVRAVMAETLGEETAAWFFDGLVYEDTILDAYIAEGADQADRQLERRGELCIPTEVQLDFVGEPPESVLWPCDAPAPSLSGEGRLTSVRIDPERELLVDLARGNNMWQRSLDWRAWLGVVVRAVYTLENFFFWGGAVW